jgi:hypothetical protein
MWFCSQVPWQLIILSTAALIWGQGHTYSYLPCYLKHIRARNIGNYIEWCLWCKHGHILLIPDTWRCRQVDHSSSLTWAKVRRWDPQLTVGFITQAGEYLMHKFLCSIHITAENTVCAVLYSQMRLWALAEETQVCYFQCPIPRMRILHLLQNTLLLYSGSSSGNSLVLTMHWTTDPHFVKWCIFES